MIYWIFHELISIGVQEGSAVLGLLMISFLLFPVSRTASGESRQNNVGPCGCKGIANLI
jgi:hypothetical protein